MRIPAASQCDQFTLRQNSCDTLQNNGIAKRTEALTKHNHGLLSFKSGFNQIENVIVPRPASIIEPACTTYKYKARFVQRIRKRRKTFGVLPPVPLFTPLHQD